MAGAAIACRLMRLPFWVVADCAAPGVVLGQAIGRLANYVSQELYGHPSNLPWAIRIDNPVPPYLPGRAFQPAFAYEALWDLAVLAVLLVFARRVGGRIRPGTVFALYAGLYAIGRLAIERIRIDHTTIVLGQRVEIWVSLVVLVLAASAFALLWRRRVTI
jgi:prolipoprotein diacylglyceryl transferase